MIVTFTTNSKFINCSRTPCPECLTFPCFITCYILLYYEIMYISKEKTETSEN